MSIDENSNENEASVSEQHVAEETATQQASAPVEPQVDQTAEDNNVGNMVASVLALRESNPKVFYGGIAGVVLLLVVMISGGSDDNLPVHKSKPVVVGQNYVLKSANAYDPNATIRLVSVPGSMAAYDDTEENDREGCKHIPDGTPVKVVQSQDAYGKKDVFVEVEMTAGECEGKKGWALAINLQ